MKILVVEKRGQLLDLLMSMESEADNQCAWYINRPTEMDVGRGLVECQRPGRWAPLIKGSDLIILSDYPSKAAESLSKRGFLVVGGDYDQEFTTKLAEASGVRVNKGEEGGKSHYIGGWFGKYKWIKPLFVSQKLYGFTQEGWFPGLFMGITGRFQGKSPLFGRFLAKLTPFLRAKEYAGYIECRILERKGRYYLSGLSTSLANPSILLQNELFRQSWTSFLSRLAGGGLSALKCMSRAAAGVGIWTKPAPLPYISDMYKGTPVGITNFDHFHPGQIQKNRDNFYTAGTSGFLGMSVGHAMTKKTAAERAYKTLEGIQGDIMYRRDLQSGLDN